MRILLVRHGDAMNSLSDRGRMQINQASEFMKSLGLDPPRTALLTSKERRAIESAEIIKSILGLQDPVRTSWLTSGTSENTRSYLHSFANSHPEYDAVIAVSHMPEIEYILENIGFYSSARNASVHEVNFDTRQAKKLFQPS